ncbi:hypothetical protein [Streptomyces sp. NPDC088762]|uniref:hypothetical protein n=1 Tax=Streptomyces sp. NPDC088762 TaxID=3365891 RepID=UPI003821660A
MSYRSSAIAPTLRLAVDYAAAVAICEQRGCFERAFPPVPTLDENALHTLYQEGTLTDTDMSAIYVRFEQLPRPESGNA